MVTRNKFERIYNYFQCELEECNSESVELWLCSHNGLDIYFTTTGEILGFRSSVKDAYKIMCGIIRSIKNGTFHEYY